MQHRASSLRFSPLRSLIQSMVWAWFASLASAQQPAARATPAAVGDGRADVASAQAQPQVEPRTTDAPQSGQTAAASFEAGLAALAQGRDKDAVAAFETAYANDANPAALMNLGIALTNLGRPHAAVRALSSYVAHADAARDAAIIRAVQEEIARLRHESGRIGLHLIPEHASVQLDAEPVDVSAGELLVPPGRHTISAHAEGYRPFSEAIDVVAGEFTLEIELEPLNLRAIAAVASQSSPAESATAPAPDEPLEASADPCVLSQICMGPVVSLLGPPNLLGGGVHARIGRYLGVGVDYQVLPTLNLNPVSFGASLLSANARVYPFGGAFFLSGGIGYQSFRGQIRDGSIALSAKTSFPALIASVGFMGRSGFVLGADLGLMFPLSTLRASIQDDTGALAQSAIPQSDIDAAREKAQNSVNNALNALPLLVQVNLLRVGYMF